MLVTTLTKGKDNGQSRRMRRRLENEFYPELDAEEQRIEDHLEEFRPSHTQGTLRAQLMEAASRTLGESRNTKKQISINLDGDVILYFKALAEETGVAYQSLINMFLVQCVKEKTPLICLV